MPPPTGQPQGDGAPIWCPTNTVLTIDSKTIASTAIGIRIVVSDKLDGEQVLIPLGTFTQAGTTWVLANVVQRTLNNVWLHSVTTFFGTDTDRPGQCWLRAGLEFTTSTVLATPWRLLFADYINGGIFPCYPRIRPSRSAGYDEDTPGRLYTFQGTVANGAGGAGAQSLTVTAATGGRFRILGATLTNGDTLSRNGDIRVEDGASNRLYRLMSNNSAIAANTGRAVPAAGAGGATDDAGGAQLNVEVAGANILLMQLAAVAASEDSAYGLILLVWGGAPTFTLAGASTPTLTTNVSRFEAG